VDRFFKDPDSNMFVTDFKVVTETPTQDRPHNDFFIQVYFLRAHMIFKVKLLRVFEYLSDLQKAVLLAFMHENYKRATKQQVNLDPRYLTFCETVGDDPTTRTDLQEQER